MEEGKGSRFRLSNRHVADWASLAVSSAGMDASAQTGSHELTIPNDVSSHFCSGNFTYSTRHFFTEIVVALSTVVKGSNPDREQ